MRHLWRAFLDLAFPRACAICGRPPGLDARQLCWDCVADLPLITMPFCSVCGDPADGVTESDFVCGWCRDRPPPFERARSAVRFHGAIRDLLHAFKYQAAIHLTPDLSGLLEGCVRAHYGAEVFDAVCCVPLYPARERERGYNQARLLADDLARHRSLPFMPRLLRRIRSTGTQTRLSAPARAENVRGAFAVADPAWVRGRRLLLVDDVMTTGSTVAECARVLRSAGAWRVFVATIARGG